MTQLINRGRTNGISPPPSLDIRHPSLIRSILISFLSVSSSLSSGERLFVRLIPRVCLLCAVCEMRKENLMNDTDGAHVTSSIPARTPHATFSVASY